MTKPGFLSNFFPRRQAALRVNRPSSLHERRASFDAAMQKSIDSAAKGRGKDADEVFDRLEAKYKAMSKPAK
jgi:hypothetical protein